MNISQAGLEFITSFEGYHKKLPDGRCQAYRCIVGRDANGNPVHDGKWTIGFGCTEGIYEGLIWTRAQADEAFRRELAKHEAAVMQLATVSLAQPQFDALVSLSYNIGTGIGSTKAGLANSSVLRRLNAGDVDGAAANFALYKYSKGIVVPGLVRRRAAEAGMFLKPDEDAPEPSMPQTVEAPAQKEQHADMHSALQQASTLYSAHGNMIRSIAVGSAATMAFLREHALEIAIVALVGVVAFELLRYAQRASALKRGSA